MPYPSQLVSIAKFVRNVSNIMADDRYRDEDKGHIGGRISRFARVGAGMGGIAARVAGNRILGRNTDHGRTASDLKAALGGLKGPLMKVAQMLATVPDLVPPEYAEELAQLQTNAPPMGWPFVRRRMKNELGADWQSKLAEFEREAAHAASLGQVHRARHLDGRSLACKLQYPDMQSAVEADLAQLKMIFSLYRRMDSAVNPAHIAKEVGARLREELDYDREAAHMRLYGTILASESSVTVPKVVDELSTRRLLTMTWEEGAPILSYKDHSLEDRNTLARALFQAWWLPFSHFAVIHGDPHLGNYSVREGGAELGVNLLDFGCVRIFPAAFVGGVVNLYRGLEVGDRDMIVGAYESWGFENLTNEMIDALNIWASFIYGPLLDNRVRTVADGVLPGEYGRREAFEAHKALREHGPVTPPREFVFMDRAAVGLGAVFLHLGAELNFYHLFNEAIENFDVEGVGAAQVDALDAARVPDRMD
jgi:predicted unusual protein kinase regulating ubiquinone biosynthesis (AarF/ABC1/UbiB family)